MKKINSCRKGKAGERELANLLKKHGIRAWRGAQHSGKGKSGQVAADVVTPDASCHWECKRDNRLNIDKAMDQAVGDCPDGDLPIVYHRKDRRQALVTFRAEDAFKLIKNYFGI